MTLVLGASLMANTSGQDSLRAITDLNTLKTKPSHMETRNYFLLKWHPGNVYLFDQRVIANQQIRLDLDNNLIEIKTQYDTKILEGFKVQRFDWINDSGERSVFVNCAGYQYATWVEGFYRILVEGEISLLERTQVKVEKDQITGSIGTERYTEDYGPDELEKLLYIAESKIVMDLARKKEILNYFGDMASDVEAHAKEHRLSFRANKDLIQILEYFNSLP